MEVVPPHHQGGQQIAGVVAGHYKQQLSLRLDLQPHGQGGGHQGHLRRQNMGRGEEGAEHPPKSEKLKGGHHRCGQRHGQIHAARQPVEQGGQHRGGDDVILVSVDPALGKQAFLLPDVPGDQSVAVRIRVQKPGQSHKVDDGKGGQISGQQGKKENGPDPFFLYALDPHKAPLPRRISVLERRFRLPSVYLKTAERILQAWGERSACKTRLSGDVKASLLAGKGQK